MFVVVMFVYGNGSAIAASDGGGCPRLFDVVKVVYVDDIEIVDVVVCDCTYLFEEVRVASEIVVIGGGGCTNLFKVGRAAYCDNSEISIILDCGLSICFW